MLRVILDILLLVSVITLPAWVSLVIVLVLIFYFKNFYEAIVAGLIIDILYSSSTGTILGLSLIYTLLTTAMFVVVHFLKGYLRIYDIHQQ